MKKCMYGIAILLGFAMSALSANAQKVALKTNLLMDADASVAVGVEVGLAKHWTIDLSGDFRPWTLSHSHVLKYWMVQPELRYWTCRKFGGSFFGLHFQGAQAKAFDLNMPFNFLGSDFNNLNSAWNIGHFYGVGIGYGYAFMLGKHINLELEAGIGYNRFHYKRTPVETMKKVTINHNYFGPTKLAFNFVYVF